MSITTLWQAAGRRLHGNGMRALVALVILAAALRFAFLGDHSLWVDELFSLMYAKLSPGELLTQVSQNDNHPPLYYLLLSFWIRLAGESEFAIRSLSAVFGILAVAVTYALGRLLFDRKVALGAALLLAVAKFAIYYSQEARMYSLLMFLAPLSAYTFWRLVHEPRPAHLAGYVLSTVLLLYTQSYGVFIVVAENAYLLTVWLLGLQGTLKIKLRLWVRTQLGAGVLFLPWVNVLLARVGKLSTEGFWVDRPSIRTLAGSFSEFSGSGHALRVVLVSLLVVAAIRLMVGAVTRIRSSAPVVVGESASLRANLFLFLCLLTPVVLPFAASQISTPIYVTRAAGVGYFAFCLLVAEQVWRLRYKPVVFGVGLLIVGLALRTLFVPGYAHTGAYKYRELVDDVSRNAPVNALVVLCGDDFLSWPLTHYATQEGMAERVRVINDDVLLQDADQLNKHLGPVWLVTLKDRAESMQRCKTTPEWFEKRYGPGAGVTSPAPGFEITAFKDLK